MNIVYYAAPTIALSTSLSVAPAEANKPDVAGKFSHPFEYVVPAVQRKAILLRTEIAGTVRERHLLGCDAGGNLLFQYVTVLWLRDVLSDGTVRIHTRVQRPGAGAKFAASSSFML